MVISNELFTNILVEKFWNLWANNELEEHHWKKGDKAIWLIGGRAWAGIQVSMFLFCIFAEVIESLKWPSLWLSRGLVPRKFSMRIYWMNICDHIINVYNKDALFLYLNMSLSMQDMEERNAFCKIVTVFNTVVG